ncbi:MAG: hypothetical protein KAG20_06480, partial [Cocleimonas sp.]|nr:hypothetical protein [Cocleimonas sp.]
MPESEVQREPLAEAQTSTMSFADLLENEVEEKFQPSDDTKSEIESAIHTLAEQALQNTNLIKEDSFETIERLISEIDKKMSQQMSLVLHNEEFQE